MPLNPSPQPVRPGDLITAKYINDLISSIVGLESRVAQLEQGAADAGRLSITEVLPSNTIRSGEQLTVLGRNFEVPVALNTVLVGSQRVMTFNEATENRMAFNVPFIANTRTAVDLKIQNSNGEASFPLTVDPPAPQVPKGSLSIQESFGDLGVIQPGQTYTYFFTVTSETDINEAYRFQVSFTDSLGAPATAWQVNAAIVAESNSILTQPVLLTANVSRKIGVRVQVPSGLAAGTTVIMKLFSRSQNSPSDPLLNRTHSTSITINQQQETSSDKISFTAPLVFGTGGRLGTDGAVEVPIGGGLVRVQIESHFQVGGDYDISVAFEPAADTIWAVNDVNPLTTTEEDGGDQQINVRIRSLAADTATERFLVVRVESTQTNTGESIISWTRIRVRAYQP